jgi:hypothetical protein
LNLHRRREKLRSRIYNVLTHIHAAWSAHLNLRDLIAVTVRGIALGYGLDDRGFESRQELGIFLFTTVSGPALGPTQLPILWVTGALFPWG